MKIDKSRRKQSRSRTAVWNYATRGMYPILIHKIWDQIRTGTFSADLSRVASIYSYLTLLQTIQLCFTSETSEWFRFLENNMFIRCLILIHAKCIQIIQTYFYLNRTVTICAMAIYFLKKKKTFPFRKKLGVTLVVLPNHTQNSTKQEKCVLNDAKYYTPNMQKRRQNTDLPH